ncbi:titin-like [Cheilinus undulatus]|uniref:titin-like n=1 Tax=Cheilinus undulatus TaxID=241271 RepID=UPI001BD5FC38|nr:titin-like [Cheilinus undulatus]
MAYKKPGASYSLICLGLLLLSSSFCQSASLTNLMALDELRTNSTHGHGQTEANELRNGRLLIWKNTPQGVEVKGAKDTQDGLEVDMDYQADVGLGESKQPYVLDILSKQKQDNTAVEHLLKMEPKVECTGDSMKLQVQGAASTPGSLLLVDRGAHLSPLPLSKLPPSCGYSVKSTLRDLVLVAPYDGCFVALEEDTYVLPLHWWGLPVKMSCPLLKQSSPNPPMVTCHAEGMVVKTEWTTSVAKIKVKLTGDWEPLMTASPRCGFSVVTHPEGVVISVRYAPCLRKMDGMYTLELAGDGETKISCPSLSPAVLEPNKNPGTVPNQQNNVPSKQPSPTVKPPSSLVPKKNGKQAMTPSGQVQQPFYPYPYYIQPQPQPATKPAQPPQPETHWGQVHQQLPVQPEAKKPTVTPKPSQPTAPQGQVHQQFYLYPYSFYSQLGLDNPTAKTPSKQPQPVAPQGEVQMPHFTKHEVKEPPTEKPAAALKPEAPRGQFYQQFYHYPFYPWPQFEKEPAAKPQRPPQLEAPKSEVHQKPKPAPAPSQPEAPQGTVHQTAKPPAAKTPPHPEVPPGQEYSIYPYLYYTQPEPETQSASTPTQPHRQGNYPFLPKPAGKPTAVSNPKKPEVPNGQMTYPFYYPFYPQPEPENKPATKPTAPLEPTKTQAPPGQVDQLFPPQVVVNPTAIPKPQQPSAPQGHMVYPFYYPFYPQPKPENKPIQQPTAPLEPTKTQAPPGQVDQPLPPQMVVNPTAIPKPQQPSAPQGHMVYPFYYPFYPQPEPENKPVTKPTAPQEPTKTQAPPGRVDKPLPPKPAEKPTGASKPQQPEAPKVQMTYPFYYPFYPQPEPENKPAQQPTAPLQPTKPQSPKGQVNQRLPPQMVVNPTAVPKPQKPLAPHLETENKQPAHAEDPSGKFHHPKPVSPPGKMPTAPKQPEDPGAHEHRLFFPYYYPYGFPFYSPPEPANQPAGLSPSEGQLPKPNQSSSINTGTNANIQSQTTIQSEPAVKNPHQDPQLVTIPPTKSVPQPQQTNIPVTAPANPQSGNGGKNPQSGPPHAPPVYCPQSCPSGLSNCCVQIAFHQHLHHIVPAKEAPLLYPGLPFLPSAYSGFGQGTGNVLIPPGSTEATKIIASKTSTSEPAASESPPSENKQPYHQLAHENPEALKGSNPHNPTNQQQIYPYVFPNSVPPYWPYLPQNPDQQKLQHSPSSIHYNLPSQPQAPSNDPGNAVVQHGKPSAVKQNKPATNILPSDSKSTDSQEPIYDKVQQEPHVPVSYYLTPDAQAPIYNYWVPNHLAQQQPSGSSSKESGHQTATSTDSEPKSFVLLQHGPPEREMTTFSEPNLPLREGVHNANSVAPELQNPQNSWLPQENSQYLNWLGKAQSSSLSGNLNYLPSPDDGSSFSQHFSASAVPHSVPLSLDPFSAENIKPKFPKYWRPMARRGSGKRSPPLFPAKTLQRRSSAISHPGNGLNQRIQREGGNWKQK